MKTVYSGGSWWDLRDVEDIVNGVTHDSDVHRGKLRRECEIHYEDTIIVKVKSVSYKVGHKIKILVSIGTFPDW